MRYTALKPYRGFESLPLRHVPEPRRRLTALFFVALKRCGARYMASRGCSGTCPVPMRCPRNVFFREASGTGLYQLTKTLFFARITRTMPCMPQVEAKPISGFREFLPE